MLKRLWQFLLTPFEIGLGDQPISDSEHEWECGPQGTGHLTLVEPESALPKPTRPAPPMPECKPNRREGIERELAWLKARVRKLEEQARN